MNKMVRKKVLLDFLVAIGEEDLDGIRDLWSKHSSDIARRLFKGEAIGAYNFFKRHGMDSERNELYDIATRYNHPASQELIDMKYIKYIR